jgi:4-amino-4-deoxy-L-arabinose transferase-like glycosyltransferase
MTVRARLRIWDYAIALAIAATWVAIVRPGPISLPYFWDEADVYVPGARWVAENGLDVTPGVFPDDYSRGHPPLFYLLAAAVFASLGSAPAVGHLVVLPFTALSIAGTYWLGACLFGRIPGACAAAVVATTPMFMSIGNMLLPEVPLTAGTVLALFALSRGRLGVAVGLACLLVLVKETGIFTGAAIGGAVLYEAWHRGELRSRATLGRAALATLPLVTLLAFFGWQKLEAGYFVFPHHQSLFADRPFGLENLATVLPSTLGWHGRGFLVAGAAVVLAAAGRAGLRAYASAGAAPEGCVPSRGAVLVAFALLLLTNAIFFAKMFWLERYALPAHPGIAIAAVGAIAVGLGRVGRLGARGKVVALAAFTAAVAAMGVAGMWSPTEPEAEEQTFAYADVIATHRAAFAALDPDAELIATTWPLTVELEQPHLGYVASPRRTVHAHRLASDPELRPDAILVSTASGRADALRDAARARGLTRRGVFQHGLAPAVELWAREGTP